VGVALAGSACAQSSVAVYGVLDTGLTWGKASGSVSTRALKMSSGSFNGSRLGFRGKEDLGAGLAVSFWLEGTIFTDDGRAGGALTTNNQTVSAAGSGLNFSRRSTIGLSGPFGELRLGRDLVPSYWNLSLYDPFLNNGVGTNVMLGVASALGAPAARFGVLPAGVGTSASYVRASNMISYFTPPTLGGFYAQAAYWFGENARTGAANDHDGNGSGLRMGYASGPFDGAIAWGRTKASATPVATTPGAPSGDNRSWNIGASWDFGAVRVMSVYGRDVREGTAGVRGRGWLMGATAPVGVGEVKLSYGAYRIDGGAGADPSVNKLTVGYVHNLSKRTALYATIAHLRNRNGAQMTLGGAILSATSARSTSMGTDVGIRLIF
jgi:predicted porin